MGRVCGGDIQLEDDGLIARQCEETVVGLDPRDRRNIPTLIQRIGPYEVAKLRSAFSSITTVGLATKGAVIGFSG